MALKARNAVATSQLPVFPSMRTARLTAGPARAALASTRAASVAGGFAVETSFDEKLHEHHLMRADGRDD